MAMTHFLYGSNGCFINEFRGTRKIAIDNWLTFQHSNNTELLRKDDEVRREVSKLMAQRIQKESHYGDQHRNHYRRHHV
jgi:hypothetical protein